MSRLKFIKQVGSSKVFKKGFKPQFLDIRRFSFDLILFSVSLALTQQLGSAFLVFYMINCFLLILIIFLQVNSHRSIGKGIYHNFQEEDEPGIRIYIDDYEDLNL